MTVNRRTSEGRRTVRRDAERERLRAALAAAEHDKAELLIENGRLRAEREATADILRALAGGTAGVQSVLDRIAQRAAQLFAPTDARLVVIRNGARTHEAHVGTLPFRSLVGQPVLFEPSSVGNRALREHRPVHLPDVLDADPAEYGVSIERAATSGWRTILVVPLLSAEGAMGLIMLRRKEVRPFTDEDIALVESFADQAVIAIENARLFAELQERDARRRHELERAAGIQQRLLPTEVEGWPGVLEVAVRFRPAVETSGDFYDVLALPQPTKGTFEPLQIAVGDVAGKGMSAALVTALARSALRTTTTVPV